MKVFIADGSHLGSGRLFLLLSDVPGFELIGFAQEAPVAAQTIRVKKPDVVILDIEMRGGSGMNLLRQIKQEAPSVKVVVVTNASHEQYRKKCSEYGADYFFDKSTEFHKVPDVVRALVEQAAKPSAANHNA